MRGAEMKRWLVRICVLLILGAIVNVAVAIWRARDQPRLRIIPEFPDRAFEDWPRVDATSADREWLAARGWQPTPRDDIIAYRLQAWIAPHRPGLSYCVVGELSVVNPLPLPDVGAFAGSFMDEIRPALREIRSGWPTLSMQGRISNLTSLAETQIARVDWQPPSRIVEAEQFPFPGPGPAYSAWIVPTVPTWPGFAINTVFYAFVLWLLFAAPFAVRRRRRIKRGLCPKCAYDMRGSAPDSRTCPECGRGAAG